MKIKNEVLEMVRKNTKTRREIARNLELSDASMVRISEEEGEWMNASEILQDFRKNRLINRNDFGKIGAVSLGVSLTNLGFEYKSIRKEGKIPFKRYHVKRLYINNL